MAKKTKKLTLAAAAKRCINGAIKVLETKGWVRGMMVQYAHDDNGLATKPIGYCMLGALEKADGKGEQVAKLATAMAVKGVKNIAAAEAERAGFGVDYIPDYNDADARTLKQVLN